MKRVGDILGTPAEPEEARKPGRARVNPAPLRSGDYSPQSAIRNPQSADVCPICLGRGFLVYDVPVGHPDFGKAVACRCTQARLAAERLHSLHQISNLGALSRMTFDSFDPNAAPETLRPNLRAAYDLSLDFAQDPRGWLVLLGGYGCGKTHLAAAIANFRIALGNQTLFVVVPDLLDHLRATYAPNSTVTYDERLEAIRDAPLLILDDLGAHNTTAWAQEKLFQILNHRYNNRQPTVITSNQRLDELDPRIASRLEDPDLSRVTEIPTPDFRQPGVKRGPETLSTLDLHADQTFDSFSLRAAEFEIPEQRENLQRAKELAQRYADSPTGWLVISGRFGCGKTHLAAAIASRQITLGRPASMFVVVPDLLDHLRATFSPQSTTSLDRVFEQVKKTPLLILDDLGTESATPWAREKLFQLLNYRYAARLPTVITMSDSIEDVMKKEPRLGSRMLDQARCIVFAIIVPSYRGSETQQAAKRAARKPKT